MIAEKPVTLADAIREYLVDLGRFRLLARGTAHPVKLVGVGNHEFFLEADPVRKSLVSSAAILINEGVEVDGLKF